MRPVRWLGLLFGLLVVSQLSCGSGQTDSQGSGQPGGSGGDAASGAQGGGGAAGGAGGATTTTTGTKTPTDDPGPGIGPVRPNRPPKITTAPVTAAVEGKYYFYPVLAEDPDGDLLGWSFTGPEGMTLDDDTGLLAWLPGAGSMGSAPVTVKVVDPSGDSDEQAFQIAVANGQSPPRITSEPSQAAAPGAPFTYQAAAEDPDDLPAQLTWSLAGPSGASVDAAGKVTWPSPTNGNTTFTLTVTDSTQLTDTQVFTVGAGGTGAFPTALLIAPPEGSLVNSVVDVTGTATDEAFAGYELELCGGTGCIPVERGLAPVVSGKLGELDPAALPDGKHQLRLTVKDAEGHVATATRNITVHSDEKPGRVRLAFEDLTVRTTGFEVSVDRIYDGVDPRSGPLGNGWRLEFSLSGKVQLSHPLHDGWDASCTAFGCDMFPTVDHTLTFELPDGRQIDFTVELEHEPGFPSSISYARPLIYNDTFDGSTLELLDEFQSPYSTVSYDLFFARLTDQQVYTDFVQNDLWQPSYYRVSTPFGEQFLFNAQTGAIGAYTDENGFLIERTATGLEIDGKDVITIESGPDGKVSALTNALSGDKVTYERNAVGDLVKVTGVDGEEQTFVYAPGSLLKSFKVPGAQPEVWKLDEKGRVVLHITPEGVVSTTEYDDVTRTVTTSDVGGNKYVTQFDEAGHITKVTNPFGKTASFSYVPGTDLEASRTDEAGHTWAFEYDPKGRVTERTDPMSHVTTYKHEPKTGMVTEVTDAEGRAYKVTTDGAGLPTAFVQPDGQAVRTFSYPNEGTEITTDVGTGNVVTIQRDPRGRVLSRSDSASGQTETITYDDAAHTATFTSPSGTMTAELDPLGRFKALDMGESGSFAYVRNRQDIPLSVTTPAGTEYTYERNKKGVVTKTLVDGAVAQETRYDAYGRVASVKSATGEGTSFKYDPAGRVTEEKSDGGTVTFTYHDDGRKKTATSSTGASTAWGYDPAGRLTTLASGNSSFAFTYDDSDRPLSATDGEGRTATMAYDANGRQTKLSFGGVGESVEYGLSDRTEGGPVKKWTDTSGVAHSYTYDASGRLVSVTAVGKVTSYDYDDQGGMVLTDALGHVTTRAETETQITVTSPEDREETWQLEGGKVSVHERADGSELHYADIPDGTSMLLPSGEVFEETTDLEEGWTRHFGAPGGGVTVWSDEASEPFFLSLDDGANVALERGPGGEVLKVTAKTPKGATFETSYGYDAAGRITSIVDPGGQTTTLTYDAAGLVATVSRPNGVLTTITYEPFERPKTITHTKGGATVAAYVYTYDSFGRVITAQAPEATTQYGYDALGRLTQETRNGAVSTRAYDDVGNLVSLTTPAGQTTFTYDKDDRLLSQAGAEGAATYSYNGRGALTKIEGAAGITSYSYDDLDRLVAVTLPSGATTSYAYDTAGRRLTISDANGTRRCLPLPATPKGWDDCALTYSPGDDESPEALVFGPLGLASVHAGAARFTLTSLHDTIARVTDAGGAVSGSWEYDAWGRRTGAAVFDHGFAGERQDPGSGLVFLRSRHYHPALGRFLTPDRVTAELRDPRTLHRYLYANGDPLNRIDPSGGFSCGEMFSVQGIQSQMKNMKSAAVHCAKNGAITMARNAVAQWAANMAFSMMKSVLGSAGFLGLLTGGALAATATLKPEQAFSKAVNHLLCKMAKNDAAFGAGYFEFEVPINHCGRKPKKSVNNLDCSQPWTTTTGPNGSGANLSGIDILAGGKLGIELKYSGSTMGLPKNYNDIGASHHSDQLVRYCRFGSMRGGGKLGVIMYYFVDFPDEDYHATYAKVCWNCWNNSKFKYMVAKCKSVSNSEPGAIYLAFGVQKNKQGKRSYVPSRSTFCGK